MPAPSEHRALWLRREGARGWSHATDLAEPRNTQQPRRPGGGQSCGVSGSRNPVLAAPPQTGRNNPARPPQHTFSPSSPLPDLSTRPVDLRPSAYPLKADSPCPAYPGFAFRPKSPRPELRLVSPPFGPLPCAAREPAHRRILSGSAVVPGGPAGSASARWQKRCVETETRLIL